MEPARSHPARAQPAVERHRGVGHEARGAHLLDGGIPSAFAQPIGANEASRQRAAGAHLEVAGQCRCVAAQKALPRCLGAVGVGEIVAVIGRHGIGMDDEPAAARSRRHVAHDGLGSGAGRGVILGVGRLRVEPDDDEGAERLHRADRISGRGGESRRAADVGMQLAGAHQLGRALGRHRGDLDLVRIVRRVDGQLVAAPRHRRDQQERDRNSECTARIHRQTPTPSERPSPHPRSARTTFSSASASLGAPWKMISPRSMA